MIYSPVESEFKYSLPRLKDAVLEFGVGILRKNEQEVDGTSILSILTLSCPKGTEIQARIVGEDSEAFMEALEELFEQKFGEDK